MSRIFTAAAIGAAVLIAGCGGDSAPSEPNASAEPTPSTRQAASPRQADFAQIARGGRLYAQNCAECHGESAQGAPNWRQRGPDGRFPPPPLNGSGHAWHHPLRQLQQVIKHGSPGGGNMPAWSGRLSDAEIDAIIAWFQAQWPDEVYAAWRENNARAEARRQRNGAG